MDVDSLIPMGFGPTVVPANLDWSMKSGAYALHSFTDDYRLGSRCRAAINRAGPLTRFAVEPDYTWWWDAAPVEHLHQLYRARAVGNAWRERGISVLPVLTWGPVLSSAQWIGPGSWAAIRRPSNSTEEILDWSNRVSRLCGYLGGLVIFGRCCALDEWAESLGLPVLRAALRPRSHRGLAGLGRTRR